MAKKIELDDQSVEALERRIPNLAKGAFRQAALGALASGRPLLVAREGRMERALPDGSREVVRELPSPVELPLGQVRRRKRPE